MKINRNKLKKSYLKIKMTMNKMIRKVRKIMNRRKKMKYKL